MIFHENFMRGTKRDGIRGLVMCAKRVGEVVFPVGLFLGFFGHILLIGAIIMLVVSRFKQAFALSFIYRTVERKIREIFDIFWCNLSETQHFGGILFLVV